MFSSFHRSQPSPGQQPHDLRGEAITSVGQPASVQSSVLVIEATEQAQAAPTVAVEAEPDLEQTELTDTLPIKAEIEQEVPGPDWVNLSGIPLEHDQLGLANPTVIFLLARLPGFEPVRLEATLSGIYRPPNFRPAPWSGFAYDQANDVLSGLAAGTRILTARGEVEVERLMPGDAALALRTPALLPISWIGRSTTPVRPIRIESGALGPNIPRRAISLGPDQTLFIKPSPVTARTLVNGTTIREIDSDTPDLFHVDVGRAEVLFAEGIPLSSGHRASLRTG